MMMMKHTHTERRKRKQSKRLSLSISISFIHSFSNINIYNCVFCVCVRFIRIFSYTHWDKRTLYTEITLRKKNHWKNPGWFFGKSRFFGDFFLIFFFGFFGLKIFKFFSHTLWTEQKKNKEKTWKKVKILKKIKINLMMIIKMIFEKLD